MLKRHGWYTINLKHTCDDDWNHPVDDQAETGVEMPSTIQSITFLSFARLKCSFLRKPRCTETKTMFINSLIPMCRSGDEPHQSEPDEGWRSNRTSTQCVPSDHSSRYEFASRTIPLPDKCTKRTYLVDSQPLTYLLRWEPPRDEDHPTSDIVGTVQDGVGDNVCEEFPSLLCVWVGFVGGDSVAGIEPKDAGFGEGCKVSGWLPPQFEKNRGQQESRGEEGKRWQTLFLEERTGMSLASRS